MAVPEGSGALSVDRRFDRVEDTLIRIEEKLDQKVNINDNAALIRRIEQLEAGESPLAKVLVSDLADMKRSIHELLLHGSINAQEAAKHVESLEGRIVKLEAGSVASITLADARRSQELKRDRVVISVLSLISTLALLLGALDAVLH